jgi:hypothetical protein
MSSVAHNNAKMPRLPDFIHVGPPRTGTTWLHEVLTGHVGLPRGIKETHFFDDRFDQGVTWYARHFRDYPADFPIGEIAPTYFSNSLAIDRIRKLIPQCKVICTFREPAERLYSLYRMYRKEGHQIPDSFYGFWQLIVAGGSSPCSYAGQLRQWQRAFGEPNVLTLFYDDLNSDPQGYLDRVCDFVGIARVPLKHSPVGESKVYSTWSEARPNPYSRSIIRAVDWFARHHGAPLVRLGKNTRVRRMIRRLAVTDFEDASQSSFEQLKQILLPEVEALEQLTGRDLSGWKPGFASNFGIDIDPVLRR